MPPTMPDPEPGTTRPALATVANVEVLEVGTWAASTGVFTVTQDDLAAAVAAFDDPGYSRPPVKLGHIDPRFDGEPALGRLINPRLSADGMTLVVDIAGVPGWLADIMADAFPGRSIEAQYNLSTQTGSKHKFALTALSLLGVQAPAVSTLADIAARFGMDPEAVAASAHQSLEESMPEPVRVAASVNLDTVRQSFYGEPGQELRSKVGGSWSWVREVYNDFIVVDDDEGHLFRVPWSEDPDNVGQVTWGEPSPVRVEYVAAAVAASGGEPAQDALRAGGLRARLAAMATEPTAQAPAVAPTPPGTGEGAEDPATPVTQPTPEDAPPAVVVPPNDPAAEPDPTKQKELSVSDDIRSLLGVPDDADDDAIKAAIEELKTKAQAQPEPPAEPQPEPTPNPEREAELVSAAAAVNELKAEVTRLSQEVAASKAKESATVKASLFEGAIKAGKITPADRESWEARYDRAPEVITDILASIAPGTAVPVMASGEVGAAEPTGESFDDAEYARFFATSGKDA